MIKEELNLLLRKTGSRELKKFAYSVGTVFLIVAAYLYYKSSGLYIYPALAGLMLIIVVSVKANSVKKVYIGWMIIAILIGYVMTRVILTIIYFLIFTPVGLVVRLLGKDILQQRIQSTRETYWVDIRNVISVQERAEKQF